MIRLRNPEKLPVVREGGAKALAKIKEGFNLIFCNPIREKALLYLDLVFSIFRSAHKFGGWHTVNDLKTLIISSFGVQVD